MKKISRKTFLKLVAATGSAAALSACGDNAGSNSANSGNGGSADSIVDVGDGYTPITNMTSANFDISKVPGIGDVLPDPSRESTANTDKRLPRLDTSTAMIPADLTPFSTSASGYMNWELFEPLAERVSVNEWRGRLAKSWVESADKKSMDVEIFDYIYDSQGNHMTADDVVFAVNTIYASGNASNWDLFGSVEKTGDYTVRYNWKVANDDPASFNNIITAFLFTQAAYESNDFTSKPVGTGPYVMTDYVSNSYVEMVPNEDYWQTDDSVRSPAAAQNIDLIHMDFVSDSSISDLSFKNGEIALTDVAENNLDSYLADGEYADAGILVRNVDIVTMQIVPNMSGDSILSNKDLRLGIFYGVNTEDFALMEGRLYQPAVNLVNRNIADYDPAWEDFDNYQTTYDPELAAEYLKKGGYNGETLKVLAEGNTHFSNVCQVMQATLEAIGVKLEITQVDRAVFNNNIEVSNGWDIVIGSCKDYIQSSLAIKSVYGRTALASIGKPMNLCNDETLFDMIDECCTTSGYSKEKTHDIMEYIYDNAYGMATSVGSLMLILTKKYAQCYQPFGQNFILDGASEFYLDM